MRRILLRFIAFSVCVWVALSLLGCGASYEIIPTASYLPSSAQVQAEKAQLAVPADLRAKLDDTAKESCTSAQYAGAARQYIAQMPSPEMLMQRKLLETLLFWAAEKPPKERLRLQTEQMQAEADASLTIEDPRVQYTAGTVAGAAVGVVPVGPVMADVAIELGVLPKGTYYARVGRTCGEFISGVVQIVVGCSGMSGGAELSATGSGAILGIPIVVGSALVYANGCATTAHALGEAQQLWNEGLPSESGPAQPELLQPKPKPVAPAPIAVKPSPPAQTRTSTRNKTTEVTESHNESGTTTTSRPKGTPAQATATVKGKPSAGNAQGAARSEPPQLARGKRAHKEEPVLPGETMEAPTPSGKRMDRYNPESGHIREIKPDNPRQIKAGEKQVEQYRQEMENATGRPHTGEVNTYDPKKY